jgi:hypothetical protein
VVQGCVALLREQFAATIECDALCREQVSFPLPEALRTKDEG